MKESKFIAKHLFRLIFYAILSFIVYVMLQTPIVDNSVALGQMQNDNAMYIAMDVYNKIKPVTEFIYKCITVWFAGSFVNDLYKLIKKENKGEN